MARSAIDERAAAGEQSLVPTDARAAFAAGSLMALLARWLDNDMPYSPKTMADLHRQMTASV